MPSSKEVGRQKKKSMPKNSSKKLANDIGSPNIQKSSEYVTASDRESESETSPESESEEDSTNPAQFAPIGAKSKAKSASDSSDSEDGEESDDTNEMDEGYEENSVESLQDARRSLLKSTNTASKSVYFPPSGFEPIDPSNSGKPKACSMLGSENLEGKKLWYITAPASITITSVKEVSLMDIRLGRSAISWNGQEFGFVKGKDEENSYTKFMIPDHQKRNYNISERMFDETLHLQQIVQLPSYATLSNLNGHPPSGLSIPAKKPVRQQPEGLKMRFRPIGFGSGKPGTIGSGSSLSSASDEEMEFFNVSFRKGDVLTSSEGSSETSASDIESPGDDVMEEAAEVSNNDGASKAPDGASESDSTSEDSTESEGEADMPPVSNAVIKPNEKRLKRKHGDIEDSQDASKDSQKSHKSNKEQMKAGKGSPSKSSESLSEGRSSNKSSKEFSHSKLSSTLEKASSRSKKQSLPPLSSAGRNLSSFQSQPRHTEPAPQPTVPNKVSLGASGKKRATENGSRTAASKADMLTLEDRIRVIDPTLSDEQREKEIKRLKKNEGSRLYNARKRDSKSGSVSSTIDAGAVLSSPSTSVTKPPPARVSLGQASSKFSKSLIPPPPAKTATQSSKSRSDKK